ncbi:type IV pilin protein [Candidatus Avelusimicrobium fimicolum]|uniref:type IV pilin protein n=1 Tax=Candidatus Avelusimicrobium fimicolum TaxID=3416216 RepID=UPI003D10162B
MKKGFTLIELLAVVLIMGILTAVALPQYRRSLERTRVAEALQMLPSIYDARERLVTENGWTWSEGMHAGTAASNVSFKKLDMEMKGKQGANATTWVTDNFTYNLANNCVGILCLINGEPNVSANMLRGTYKGTTIYYTGNDFLCCPGTVRDSCERLNVTQASHCTLNFRG